MSHSLKSQHKDNFRQTKIVIFTQAGYPSDLKRAQFNRLNWAHAAGKSGPANFKLRFFTITDLVQFNRVNCGIWQYTDAPLHSVQPVELLRAQK